MKAYVAAMAFMVCILMVVSTVPNVSAADSVTMSTGHGTYADGTVWNTLVVGSTTIYNTTHIASVHVKVTAYYDSYNATVIVGKLQRYIYYQWSYEGSVVSEYWPITYFPMSDIYVGATPVGTNIDFTEHDIGIEFEFDRGYGTYTLTTLYLQTSFAGYYSLDRVNVTFEFVDTDTTVAAPFVLIGGVIGFLFMALAFPTMVIMVKSGRWISGIGALMIMMLIGWACFVVFVLNSGAF
jgi:hypothetical protein